MSEKLVIVGVFALMFLGMYCVETSEWSKQRDREAAAELKRRQTPHVVRESDGCKVYAFERGGRDHYFTRCPGSRTSTESSWEECQQAGKSRHCETKTETIDGEPA